jgi:hypothetical protein
MVPEADEHRRPGGFARPTGVVSSRAGILLGGRPVFSSADVVLAYLDPGTGSMALQIVIAGLLSSLYFLRSSFAQIKGWVAAHRPGR